MLAVLFVVRLTMAFQFQSVAAEAPRTATPLSGRRARIGRAIGWVVVYVGVAALAAAGFVLLAIAYRSPKNWVMNATASARLDRSAAIAVTTAGLIWGLYNVGFAMIFSFGPTMLVERGWSISAAASIISIVLWLAVVSVPFGGLFSDRTRRAEPLLVAGSIVF